MNGLHLGIGPLTPAAASALPSDQWECMGASELALDDCGRQAVAALWLWLLGVEPNHADADRVRREVLSDGGLTVALHLPAVEFLRWFRASGWADFDSTERTGSEGWAIAVMQRTWGACCALGPLATQRSMFSL